MIMMMIIISHFLTLVVQQTQAVHACVDQYALSNMKKQSMWEQEEEEKEKEDESFIFLIINNSYESGGAAAAPHIANS